MTQSYTVKETQEMGIAEVEERMRVEGLTLLFVTDDYNIHEFEVDEGKLTFLDRGKIGWSEDTSRTLFERVVQEGKFKLVPNEKAFSERIALVNGAYESVEEWLNNE